MQPVSFYQDHLNRVSRSFAFCIARLEGDLRLWVSLSYLLCRVLDTVEDVSWPETSAQKKAFEDFNSFLISPPSFTALQAWLQLFPASIPSAELLLLQDSALLFQDLAGLPLPVQNKIRQAVQNMARGMGHFSQNKELRLKNLAEVNQYCFFVAGIVGELLTDLILQIGKIPAEASLYLRAHHFGLFLQKINLLKDQMTDEKEGRFLIPSRPQVLASLPQNATGALEYVQSIPIEAKDYRLFCAWSLFLGLLSLPWIQRSWTSKIFEKIPRLLTEKMMKEIESIIDDNRALENYFHRSFTATSSALPVRKSSRDMTWFTSLYQGSLSLSQFADLGLLEE